MKTGLVIRYVGLVMLLNAFFMLASAVVSLIDGFDTSVYPLLLSFVVTTLIGIFPMIFVPREGSISIKESYTIVVLAWIMSCLLGMLPYIMWGGEFSLVNALFESTSGFTTTGSTILADVEALPRGLLFWRASTHWIGGVGVVLFALVILPSVGRSRLSLTSAEMSTLAKDNFHYTTRKVLRIITFVYVGITVLEITALMFTGMGWFDAVTNSFSTVATGGFSVHNESIMAYQSQLVETIIIVFMVISGMHMGLIYATVRGRRNNIFTSEVARFYILSLVICSAIVVVSLMLDHTYNNWGDAIRHGVFQTVSYCTTSGFASADNHLWPPLAMLVLIYASLQCAMAGSTTGGLKVDRILLVFKAIRARITKLQHPTAVVRIKQNGIVQDDSLVHSAMLIIVFYLLCAFGGTVILAAMNIDLLTSFTACVASLSNVGPGLGNVASLENYGMLPDAAKLLLSGLMLFGRLEFFALIHIFMLRSWK